MNGNSTHYPILSVSYIPAELNGGFNKTNRKRPQEILLYSACFTPLSETLPAYALTAHFICGQGFLAHKCQAGDS